MTMLDACRLGRADVVRERLAMGASPNGEGAGASGADAPLHAAIEITKRHGRGPARLEVLRLLLAAGADPERRATRFRATPILLAAIAGTPEFIAPLREAMRERPPAEDPVLAAALAERDDVARLIAAHPAAAREPDAGGWTPIVAAAASRLHRDDLRAAAALPEIVSLLLTHRADPNDAFTFAAGGGRWSALAWTIGHADNLPLARILLDAGAAIDDPVAAFEAAVNQRYEGLALLIERGLDVNHAMVLHRLLAEPTSRGVEWLLAHGADPNVTAPETGESALHVAARSGAGVRAFRAILAHGADVNARNRRGETPLALALQHHRRRLVDLLGEAGARA